MPDLPKILNLLSKQYPDAKIALEYKNPFQLLIATILSAQSTDKQINRLTPALFSRYPTAEKLASAPIPSIETLIHSSGFYKAKAKRIKECSRLIVEKFNGSVPQTMEELLTLPGVGRKTANVVLSEAYQKNVGVCVDTHVIRVSQRLGVTKNSDAEKIEQDLMKQAPQKDWKKVTNLLITHGRMTCIARKPACERCPVKKYCEYYKLLIKLDPR